MTSKQRAELRAQANTIEPVFQVGKGGISDALITQTDDALRARELIKLKVLLDTAPESPRELAEKIAAATNSEVVQVVGGSMIFYRYSPELHGEAAKPVKRPATKKQARKMGMKPIGAKKKPAAPSERGTSGRPAQRKYPSKKG